MVFADVDGDGATDLVYLDQGRILLWGNQSGNGWTEGPTIVAGLVERSFLDLAGAGQPPYLLERVDDHAGTVTRLRYAWSTDEYLRDQPDPATRWRTGPPAAVPVVCRVEVLDRATGGRRTTEYHYRHGCADGAERGFALVEECVDVGDGAPRLARTWFHTGPVALPGSDEPAELDLSHEYSTVDPPMLRRPAALAGLSRMSHHAALRSLRGRVRRREEYGLLTEPDRVTETGHGRDSVLDLREAVLAGSACVRVIGHTRTYYDGDAGVGLPLGQVGTRGAAARTESLAIIGDAHPLEMDGYVHYGPDDVPGSPGAYYVRVESVRRGPRPIAAEPAAGSTVYSSPSRGPHRRPVLTLRRLCRRRTVFSGAARVATVRRWLWTSTRHWYNRSPGPPPA